MYPIAATKLLSLGDVAKHWAREVTPACTEAELLNLLASAWWLGGLKNDDKISRLEALKALFAVKRVEISFWVEEEPEPETVINFPDGSAGVLLSPIVPIPRRATDDWTEADCSAAFNAIAENWPHDAFADIEPIISGISLKQSTFSDWLQRSSYNPVTFWAAETPSMPPPPEPDQKVPRVNTREFVAVYIRETEAAGRLPTKKGMEQRAKDQGIRGGRDRRAQEFDQQMGGKAPSRGRPRKNIRNRPPSK
jgi:hypothetical protein